MTIANQPAFDPNIPLSSQSQPTHDPTSPAPRPGMQCGDVAAPVECAAGPFESAGHRCAHPLLAGEVNGRFKELISPMILNYRKRRQKWRFWREKWLNWSLALVLYRFVAILNVAFNFHVQSMTALAHSLGRLLALAIRRSYTNGDTNFSTSPPSRAISRTKVLDTNWYLSLGVRKTVSTSGISVRFMPAS